MNPNGDKWLLGVGVIIPPGCSECPSELRRLELELLASLATCSWLRLSIRLNFLDLFPPNAPPRLVIVL